MTPSKHLEASENLLQQATDKLNGKTMDPQWFGMVTLLAALCHAVLSLKKEYHDTGPR